MLTVLRVVTGANAQSSRGAKCSSTRNYSTPAAPWR
jgi:hypothetical protein